MNYISKHFMSDGCDQLILTPEDWTDEQFAAFRKIFGLEEAERIVITEYKIDAYAKPKLNEGDWIVACDHLNMVIAEFVTLGMEGKHMLYETLLPLKKRYDLGERTRELYDAIMAVE